MNPNGFNKALKKDNINWAEICSLQYVLVATDSHQNFNTHFE